jgi:hypothetical protein
MIKIGDIQKTFDTMCEHLYKQGKQSMEDEHCVYRASDGSRCAFGCLISDEDYDEILEGNTCSMLVQQKRVEFDNIETAMMCRIVQRIHDIYIVDDEGWIDYLNRNLANVAFDFGLKFYRDNP